MRPSQEPNNELLADWAFSSEAEAPADVEAHVASSWRRMARAFRTPVESASPEAISRAVTIFEPVRKPFLARLVPGFAMGLRRAHAQTRDLVFEVPDGLAKVRYEPTAEGWLVMAVVPGASEAEYDAGPLEVLNSRIEFVVSSPQDTGFTVVVGDHSCVFVPLDEVESVEAPDAGE